jgi:hypothetical protein
MGETAVINDELMLVIMLMLVLVIGQKSEVKKLRSRLPSWSTPPIAANLLRL